MVPLERFAYFLYEYEQHLADQAGKPVKMPWEVLVRSKKEDTIEHILPQTPTDEYWMQRFTSKTMSDGCMTLAI